VAKSCFITTVEGVVTDVQAANGNRSRLWETISELPFVTNDDQVRLRIYSHIKNDEENVTLKDSDGEPIMRFKIVGQGVYRDNLIDAYRDDINEQGVQFGYETKDGFQILGQFERNVDKSTIDGYVWSNLGKAITPKRRQLNETITTPLDIIKKLRSTGMFKGQIPNKPNTIYLNKTRYDEGSIEVNKLRDQYEPKGFQILLRNRQTKPVVVVKKDPPYPRLRTDYEPEIRFQV